MPLWGTLPGTPQQPSTSRPPTLASNMAHDTLKIKTRTTAQRLSAAPANREPVIDSSTNILYVGDGATLGGTEYNTTTYNQPFTFVSKPGNTRAFLGNIAPNQFTGQSTLSAVSLGNSVSSVGSAAFKYCGLKGPLIIPNSVTTIGNYAFNGCSGLTSLTIPNSVTSIGSYAFRNCSGLTTVNCYVTRTIMNTTSCLLGTSVTSLSARISDGTWTAGADTIGGKALTVYKVL